MAARIGTAGFIGRERELAELEASLLDAEGAAPRLALLAGDSGVGKSRLLGEFSRRARVLGARVLDGESVELGEDELPYAPLVAALRPLARAGDPVFDELPAATLTELATLAPELGPVAGARAGESGGQAQLRLFEAILALLAKLGERGSVVLIVEDLHWADRSTRGFCSFLARSLRDERLLAVLSYRSDELGRRHPLRPTLAQLERAGGVRRLDLSPFDRDELRAQLRELLGAEPDPDQVERMYARSEGNPLFTEELLAAGIEGRGGLPPTLRDALLLRVEALSASARHAMRTLAVAGRADDVTLLATGSLELDELRAGLREGIEANVLASGSDGRMGFRHALLREVVYDDLLPGERAEAHLALARALESATAPEESWRSAAVAHHYRAAGDQPAALRASVAAATEAERVHAHGEAASLLERALSLWDRVDDPESLAGSDLAGLELRAFRAGYLAGEDSRFIGLLESAISRLDPERDRLRLAGALGELANGQWARGRAERSRETLARALELAGSQPSRERARLLSHQLRQHLLQGRFSTAVDSAGEALEAAQAVGDDATRPAILARLGSALFSLGRVEAGRAAFEEAIEAARADPLHEDLATAYSNYADSLMLAGMLDEALEMIAAGDAEVETGVRGKRWIRLTRAELSFAAGDWRAARELMPEAIGTTGIARSLRRAEQALGTGDEAIAEPALDDAAELLTQALEPQYIAVHASLRAELEIRRGDTEAARRAIEEGLDRIEFCSEDVARLAQTAAAGLAVEATAAVLARDLADGDGENRARERAAAMLRRVEAATEDCTSPVEEAVQATALAEHARALASDDQPERWGEAARRWRELGRPYQRAQALWRAAESSLGAGRREQAGEELRAALLAARRLGSRWLAAELEALAARGRLAAEPSADGSRSRRGEQEERPFGLTERELQVLHRVAVGATNREIAGALFMAEKTASVHVSRILAKLGVRSRTEAAAVAHRQGLVAEVAPTLGE